MSERRWLNYYLELLGGFMKGDLVPIQRAHRPDATLYIAGDNPYAGTYEGVGMVLGAYASFGRWMQPDSVRVIDSTEGEDWLEVHVEATVVNWPDRRPMRFITRVYFDEDSKIARVENLAQDQAAFDSFLRRFAASTSGGSLSPPGQ